ncbi:MAG: phage repressor protein [Pseudomonadaceae bacterium]|nr:phage repressor protein [Pseudomonadaceae bacterium]HCP54593.1 phage repressor protein [Pseudomonas sp.]
MNTAQIIPFDFEKHPVRAVTIEGEPWFVASDICKALSVANTTQALQSLDGDERSMLNIGRQGEANIVNESGLFTLILRSRDATKPGTPQHRFRKWVTAEVLPAIRKHGRYEDTHNQMTTLVGQTIGTDGFHCLGAVLDGKVRQLPVKARQRAKMHVWSQVHKAFSVVSAQDIPANQLDSVRNFIAAYALEGEWLGKEESKTAKQIGGIFLDRRETQHLYLMMFRFSKMNEQSGNLRLAAQALASDPLSKLWSQLHEGMVSFKVLDQRRAEICGEYQAIGGSGGYAFCA